METKKYRSRIKAWAIFFWCIDTSIADTLTIARRFPGVKACSFNPSQAFTVRVNTLLPVWMLCFSSLHTQNYWKSEGNTRHVKGWILFSGNKIRIYAREACIHKTDFDLFSVICPLRLPGRTQREVFFTSRRLFRQARRVNKSTPGLLGTTRGLFGKALHHL